MKRYNVTLTEEELDIVITALEQYKQIGIGNFKILLFNYSWIGSTTAEIVIDLLDIVKKQLTELPSGILRSVSDPNTDNRCRLADKVLSFFTELKE